jgi:predicted Zn finger-like uncharacterized protein
MILTCPQCSTRLQLDASKLPSRAFSVKCPKCQQVIPVEPSDAVTGGLAVGSSAVPRTAPLPEPSAEQKPTLTESRLPKMPADLGAVAGMMEQDPVKALTAMLASAFAQSGKPSSIEPTRRRRMLVCLSDEGEIQKVHSVLQGHDFDLTFLESSEQAIELLQLSNQVDMILLDPNFEDDQGGTAILRFINSLNPGRRRRLYVTMMSPSYKTLDAQTAFANGVNLLINSSEIAMLPLALNKGIREFNLLYRSYNEASGLSPF